MADAKTPTVKFFDQCRASATQMQKIADLEPLLQTLYEYHAERARPIMVGEIKNMWTAQGHKVVAEKLASYLNLQDKRG